MSLALSRGVAADMVSLVRFELQERHEGQDFDPVVAIIAQAAQV